MPAERREKPTGIDKVIDKLQVSLFNTLATNYGWRNYTAYSRAYRNPKVNDKLPEVYCNGEYKEVLFDDTKYATSFFLVDEKRPFNPVNGTWTQGVSIIFQVQLDKLYCDDKYKKDRKDEQVIDDIRLALVGLGKESWMKEIIQGIDNVYQSLKITSDKKFDDMNSFSIVRFNLQLITTNDQIMQTI